MNFLRKLFNNEKKERKEESNPEEKKKIEEAKAVINSMPKIKPPDKNFKIDIDPKQAFEHIKQKRKENQYKNDLKSYLTTQLIKEGKYEELNTITHAPELDVIDYMYFSIQAHKYYSKGKLEEALHIFWQNIYDNGTYIKGDYDNLLKILNKLKRREEELMVAELYKLHLEEENSKEETANIDKRIKRIKKQIDNNK